MSQIETQGMAAECSQASLVNTEFRFVFILITDVKGSGSVNSDVGLGA